MVSKTLVETIVRGKPSERVHPKTLIVAGLTAVSVALIATRLTSLSGSLALVAVLSLLTAFIGEFYRMVLDFIQRLVVKQLDEYGVRLNLLVSEPTEEIPVLTDEVLDEMDREEVQREKRILWSRLAVPAVVALFAFGTVGMSYAVSHSQESPQTQTVHLTETNNVLKDISKKKEAELLASSREDSRAEAEAGRQAAVGEAKDYTTATREELLDEIVNLQRELTSSRSTLSSVQGVAADTAAQATRQAASIKTLQDRLRDAQARSDALDRRIAALESASSEG